MMEQLLFVDHGAGARYLGGFRPGLDFGDDRRTLTGDLTGRLAVTVSGELYRAATRPRTRWWALECESVERGLDFIRHNCQPCGCGGLCDSTVACPMAYNDRRRLVNRGGAARGPG